MSVCLTSIYIYTIFFSTMCEGLDAYGNHCDILGIKSTLYKVILKDSPTVPRILCSEHVRRNHREILSKTVFHSDMRMDWKRNVVRWAAANYQSFIESPLVPGEGSVELYSIGRGRLPHEDRFDTDGVRLMFLSPFSSELNATTLGASGRLCGVRSFSYGDLPTRLWPSNILIRTDLCEGLCRTGVSMTEILDVFVVSTEEASKRTIEDVSLSVFRVLSKRDDVSYVPVYTADLITRLTSSVLVWTYKCPIHGTLRRVSLRNLQLRAFLCALYERCITTNSVCRMELKSIQSSVAIGYRYRIICPYDATTDFFCMEKYYSFESVLALMCSDTAPENYPWRGVELPVDVYGLPASDFDHSIAPPKPIDM